MNMKERILKTSLRLFASDGYEAVSVSRIAWKLGVTKGALYKHYKNKRDIFDNIIRQMEEMDAERAKMFNLPEGTLGEMSEEYRKASVNRLFDYCKAQFRYWTQDDFAADFRKMLTLEQYRNDEMADLYQKYLATGPLNYVTDLFSSQGLSKAKRRATELYASMFFMYSVYDGATNKDAVIESVDRHIDELKEEILI